MAAITKIEFWSDVGFIDGAVEIPHINTPDPINPTITIEPDEPILPSKDRFFSELKLKEYYTGLLTMSYMRVTYDLKNSLGVDTPNVFYGWVDSVKLSSDGELPMTIIGWHIDEWRTWKSAVTFGSGHIKRRPFRDLATTPIQNYQRRYDKLDNDDISILDQYISTSGIHPDGCPVWWILISINFGSTNTTTRIYTFPVFLEFDNNYDCYFAFGGITVSTLSLTQLYGGLLDEFVSNLLDVTTDAINGIWLSPFSPVIDSETQMSGSGGSQSNPIIFSGSVGATLTHKTISGVEKGLLLLSQRNLIRSRAKSFTMITSTEEKRYLLTSTDGVKILDLPYGFGVDQVVTTLVMEPDGPFFEISFKNSSYGGLEGMATNIPLTMIPLNSNAFNEYVYSGHQEYDKSMRTIRSNSKAFENIGVMTSSGALMGAFGPMGAIAGGGMGAASVLLPYSVEMLYSNDKEQQIEDRLKASQPSTLILTSNSILSIGRRYNFKIKALIPDDYSSQQITATRNQFGISVDELMPSCDTLIRSTSPIGYYNIQNLIVNGNVPVSAKKWIREKFRSGVRLI